MNKLVIKLNRKKTHLSSFIEWGYGEVMIQDIQNHYRDNTYGGDNDDDDVVDTKDYFGSNHEDNKHIKGGDDCGREHHNSRDIDRPTGNTSTRQSTMDSSDHRNDNDDDLWVPIVRSTTGEQIGVMLISAIRIPV